MTKLVQSYLKKTCFQMEEEIYLPQDVHILHVLIRQLNK